MVLVLRCFTVFVVVIFIVTTPTHLLFFRRLLFIFLTIFLIFREFLCHNNRVNTKNQLVVQNKPAHSTSSTLLPAAELTKVFTSRETKLRTLEKSPEDASGPGVVGGMGGGI